MKISRREFVRTAGCSAAASLCAVPSLAFSADDSRSKADVDCTLLDLKSNCALPESFTGVRSALGDSHRCVGESELASSAFLSGAFAATDSLRRVVVVLGSGLVSAETFLAVASTLERGATVLWESGAAFLQPRHFAAQRDLASKYFGVSIEEPVQVWSQASSRKAVSARKDASEIILGARAMRAIGHQQVPYVSYRWPRQAHVREFSHVIPVSAASGHAIAHWREIPVVWSKSAGRGRLVFLGSPIGPALLAGDAEADSLLRLMIAS
jgi:hypothetical protein